MRNVTRAIAAALMAVLLGVGVGMTPVASAHHNKEFTRISANYACQHFVAAGTVAAEAFAWPGKAVCVPPSKKRADGRATTGFAPDLDAAIPHRNWRIYPGPLSDRMVPTHLL